MHSSYLFYCDACAQGARPPHSPFSCSIAKTGPRLTSSDRATIEFLLPCNKTTNANFKLAFVCSLHRQSAPPRDVGCCVRRLSKARTCSIQPSPKSYYSCSIHKLVPLAGYLTTRPIEKNQFFLEKVDRCDEGEERKPCGLFKHRKLSK